MGEYEVVLRTRDEVERAEEMVRLYPKVCGFQEEERDMLYVRVGGTRPNMYEVEEYVRRGIDFREGGQKEAIARVYRKLSQWRPRRRPGRAV